MTTRKPGSLPENPTAPKQLALRCMLYWLTFAHVLPVIVFGTLATILAFDRKWLGAFVCAVACGLYVPVVWKRLHGKLSYFKPSPILELRRQLNQRPPARSHEDPPHPE
jgi:hypothetical protein